MSSSHLRDALGRFKKKTPDMIAAAAKAASPVAALVAGQVPAAVFGKNYYTSQIYSMGFEFAFMARQKDGHYLQATTFAYCKDFFHDAVWAMVNQKPWEIYGFKYNPKKNPPLDLDNCVFAFRNTQYKAKPEDFHSKREACQELLNGFEAKMGFEPSRVFAVTHDDAPCWLVIGDKRWQHAAPMLGLYTLLIRVGFVHKLGTPVDDTLAKAKGGKIKLGAGGSDYAGNLDSSYLKDSWKFVKKAMEVGIQIFHPKMEDNYPVDMCAKGASLHDDFGPVSFTEGLGDEYASCREAMPFWYRDEIWKK